jgi:hypothetical protein
MRFSFNALDTGTIISSMVSVSIHYLKISIMKRAKRILMVMLFALMACAFGPAVAQDRPANNTTQDRYGDNTADTDYGWIGLLGLVGLFGLMKKPRETTHYNQPATKSY